MTRVLINVEKVEVSKLNELCNNLTKYAIPYNRIVKHAGFISKPCVSLSVPANFASSILSKLA